MTFNTLFLAGGALAMVLALIWLAQRAVRAAGLTADLTPGGGRLERMQALSLDPKRRLHLVRCDGRDVLLLTGGATDVVVGWLEREVP